MRRGKCSTSARTIVLAAFVVVVLPIALLLASCDAPLNLINAIEIEVMKAHNMFLEVTATTPGMEDLDVNPGTEIVIRFDRPLDETTIDGNVDVTDLAGATQVNSDWVFRYDQQTYTLTLSPFPWFASNSSYTVHLGAGLRGADGSGLLESISWSFATNDETTFIFEFGEGTRLLYANAQLEIDRGNTTVPITYTVTDTDLVEYFVTTDESEAYAPPGGAVWTLVTGPSGTAEIDLPAAGTNICYMRIRQAGLIIDVIRSASIFVDRIPPEVELGGPAYTNSAYTVSPVSVSDPGVTSNPPIGSGIDPDSYSWSSPEFTVLPATGPSTVVTWTVDATGSVSLDVSDLASNVGTGNLAFHWDLTPPTVTFLEVRDILSTSAAEVRRAADGAVSFIAIETDGRQLAGWEWRSEASPTYTSGGSLTGTSQGVTGAAVQLLDQAGTRSIDVRAYDVAGNYSTVATDDVELWVKLRLFDPLIYVDHDGDDA
ncbi:MAG: Ig-like domain-containing protein, partial [Spirochaetaceae bacterium]|nr:Ig-like domain-containing protein [Spirochaetaceae bacterium]